MKKRILYIHHGQGLGGAPLSLLLLIKTLDRTRYHPMVLFLKNSEVITLYKEQGIEVYGPVNKSDFPHTVIWSFKWYHLPYMARAIKDTIITAFQTADAWFNRLQPDLVHLNTSSLIAWGYVAHKKKIPVVWHIREPIAQGYFGLRRKFITSCVSRHATKIIPISKHDALPWITNPKTKIIPNPVDPVVFDYSLFINKNHLQPTILFVGGLSREKGTLFILEVFQQVLTRIPNAHLVIAGYFELKKEISFHEQLFPRHHFVCAVQALHAKLAAHITLTGPTTHIPELLGRSTVLVFPATVGHFARPVIEAGFMQKPVVASQLPPMDELIIDGHSGFLCEAENYTAWARTLEKLLLDPGLCKTIGLNAYNFCRQHFSLDAYGVKIETIYKAILQREKGYVPRKT